MLEDLELTVFKSTTWSARSWQHWKMWALWKDVITYPGAGNVRKCWQCGKMWLAWSWHRGMVGIWGVSAEIKTFKRKLTLHVLVLYTSPHRTGVVPSPTSILIKKINPSARTIYKIMPVPHHIYGVLATGTIRFECHLNTTFLVSLRNFSEICKRMEEILKSISSIAQEF